MSQKVGVGDAFPQFSLPDQRGQPVSSQALAGKPVVIFFYPEDNTTGCTTEATEFSEQHPQFLARDVLLYGVSTDSVRSHEGFCQRHHIQVPLLSDADAVLSKAVGVLDPVTGDARRTTFLVDAGGKVAKMWEQVRPAGHAADVLTAVEAFQEEGKPS